VKVQIRSGCLRGIRTLYTSPLLECKARVHTSDLPSPDACSR
jgi:hypothetical protein